MRPKPLEIYPTVATNNQNLLWFKDIRFEDINIVGGKGANLGEMYNLGIPVPNGFCVTARAYFKFIEANKLKPKIKALLDVIDVDDPSQLNSISSKIRKIDQAIASSPRNCHMKS